MIVKYARVSWSPGDIQCLRPNWSLEQCEEFLQENEGTIQDVTVERGWNAIESLLPPLEEAP